MKKYYEWQIRLLTLITSKPMIENKCGYDIAYDNGTIEITNRDNSVTYKIHNAPSNSSDGCLSVWKRNLLMNIIRNEPHVQIESIKAFDLYRKLLDYIISKEFQNKLVYSGLEAVNAKA